VVFLDNNLSYFLNLKSFPDTDEWLLENLLGVDHNSSLPHVVINVLLMPNLLQASDISYFKEIFSSKL
jgi:hypothetical protein